MEEGAPPPPPPPSELEEEKIKEIRKERGENNDTEEDLQVPITVGSIDIPCNPPELDSFKVPGEEKKKKKSKKHRKGKKHAKQEPEEDKPAQPAASPKDEENAADAKPVIDSDTKEYLEKFMERKAGEIPKPADGKRKNIVQYRDASSQLHYHAGTGNWEVMEDILKEDDSHEVLEATSNDGRTVLHVTAALGHLRAVEMLLDHGARIDAKMDDGLTPLMLACGKGMDDVVRLLLKRSADTSLRSIRDNYTSLHLAAMNGSRKCAELLLGYARNQGEKALVAMREAQSNKGYTAVHFAIVEGDLDFVKSLVDDYDANVDAKTTKKWTPLHFAAHEGDVDIITYLLSKRANPTIRNEGGATCYHVAVHMEHSEDVTSLLNPERFKGLAKEAKRKEKEEKKEAKEARKRQKDVIKRVMSDESVNEDEVEEIEINSQNFRNYYMQSQAGHYDGRHVWERIEENPTLLKSIQEDPVSFFSTLSPEIQLMIFDEIEKNPEVMQQVMEIANSTVNKLMNERPELLLSAINPMEILKKHKNPIKLMNQVKENPMSVLDEEYQDNPEWFLLKFLHDNPKIQVFVIEEIRKVNPRLIPLLGALMGYDLDSDALERLNSGGSEIDSPRGKIAKAKNIVAKKVMKKMLKKMAKQEGLTALAEEDPNNPQKTIEFDISRLQQLANRNLNRSRESLLDSDHEKSKERILTPEDPD